ncbi:MAG: V-type ATP synthase subunit B, partial [Methylobacter sp.]|nr:V-type ATP synthase subunit B [Methylobacter sp.]
MTIIQNLIRHIRLLEIVGDLIRVKAEGVAFGDLAVVENIDGETSLAKVVDLDRDIVSLQVFSGGKGLSTDAKVTFLGRPLDVVYSDNILGRVFRGSGEPIDGGPALQTDPRIPVGGPTVNPVMRVMPSRMIETQVPMIDLFNCLVESQKIPIFSIAGEPFNELLARIGFQANADVVVFGGMGLIFDDYHFFRTAFEE